MSELDDVLEGDDDDDEVEGDDLYGDDEELYGAAKRRAKAKRAKRGGKTSGKGNLHLRFAATACGIGAAIVLTAQTNRRCRPLDLRVLATTVLGVADPGIQVGAINVHGKELGLSGGLVAGGLFAPDAHPLVCNCDIPEIIESGETVTIAIQGISAVATVVSAALTCRAVA